MERVVAGMNERAMRMPPVLVLGLGGVGHRTVLYLKTLLVSLFGEVPTGIRLLAIDIDRENLSAPLGDDVISLEPDREFFCIGPVPVARIRQNLGNWPTIQSRLAPALQALPWVAVANAAQMIRPLGQLALQWQFPTVQEVVRAALWQLAARDNQADGARQVDLGQGFKVFVIGSLVGGTHSGMFIDVAALARSEVEALGVAADASMIVGIGMLPGAFRNVSAPNLVPNATYALEELDRIERGRGFVAEYRNGLRINLAHAPFDMYLVVDGVDEGGRVWLSRDDLCRMVARSVWLLSASRLGEQGDAIMDNFLAALHGRSQDGHARIFGSIGCAEIRFPADDIIRVCGARSAQAALALLQREPSREDVANEVEAWVRGLGLAADTVLDTIGRDENGAPMAVDLAVPSFLTTMPDDQTPQAALQYVGDYHRVKVQGDYRTASRTASEVLAQQTSVALTARMENAVKTPGVGLQQAIAVMVKVDERLAAAMTALQDKRQAKLAEVSALEIEVDQAADALRRATQAMWPFRGGKIRAACEHYFRVAQELETARLDAMLLERASATLSAIQTTAHGLTQGYALAQGQLRGAERRLAQIEASGLDALDPRNGQALFSVVDRELIDHLYASHDPTAETVMQALIASAGPGGVVTWGGMEVNTLTEALLTVAEKPFARVADITVEDAIRQHPEVTPLARRAALLEGARPSWTYDPVRIVDGDEPQRIVLLGVTDQEASLYRVDETQGISVVSTGDPHSLTALVIAAGLPLTALQAWPEWARVTHGPNRNPVLYSTFPPSMNGGGSDDSEKS